MAGKLVSAEMLENLKKQVADQLDEGSGHHIRQME